MHHRWDRAFFLTGTIIAWIAILRGFGPELYGHLTGATSYPPLIVHLHAVAFFGWLLVFTAQVWPIRSRRVAVHRRLGIGAACLVPVVLIWGVATTIVMQRDHFEAGSPELDFMNAPMADMLLFGSLATAGLLMRRQSSAHRRLMLLATISVLDAGFGRWFSPWINAHFGDGYLAFLAAICLGSDVLVLAAVLYDLMTRRRTHPVYFIAVPWIILVQAVTSWVYHAPAWLPIARRLLGH